MHIAFIGREGLGRFLIAALAAATVAAPASAADNFVVRDGVGAMISKCSMQQSGGAQADCNVLIDTAGVKVDPATRQLQQQLLTALGTPLQAGGTVTIGNAPTVNLGTIGTAATAAKQDALLTALGTPLQAGGTVNLGTLGGAATAAKQDALADLVATLLKAGGNVDTVVRSASVDIGASVLANTARELAPSDALRRGLTIQNQTSGTCYLSGLATATADYHSMLIPSGWTYESRDSHVGTGPVSILCIQAGPVYARKW